MQYERLAQPLKVEVTPLKRRARESIVQVEHQWQRPSIHLMRPGQSKPTLSVRVAPIPELINGVLEDGRTRVVTQKQVQLIGVAVTA